MLKQISNTAIALRDCAGIEASKGFQHNKNLGHKALKKY